MLTDISTQVGNKFNLKNEPVNLVGRNSTGEVASVSLETLEAMRTEARAVPASKYGLETICGASCETSAI